MNITIRVKFAGTQAISNKELEINTDIDPTNLRGTLTQFLDAVEELQKTIIALNSIHPKKE